MSAIIYGKNPVKEALEAGLPIQKIYLAAGGKQKRDQKIEQLASQRGIPVRFVDRKKIIELAGHEGTQGVVAISTEFGYSETDAVFQKADQRNEPPLIAILDEIQDPHNLGAIIRSAEAFGFHGIFIPKDRAVGLSDVVAKTSAGAISYMSIVRVTNLAREIDELKENGIWIAGADQDAKDSYYDTNLKGPLGIVIGSEGRGLRRLTREKCDFLVRIPMVGKMNSLNASVAAALLFAEARKQRSS